MDEDTLITDWRNHLAEALTLIGRWHMPFGKYGPQHYPPHGLPLHDLPAEYLIWFRQKGFPKGTLGRLLEILCELHLTGAESVLEPLRKARGGRRALRPPRRREYDFSEGETPS
jgi:uncharacterized protein (DUF3820 family)